jgi:hypothetical protein
MLYACVTSIIKIVLKKLNYSAVVIVRRSQCLRQQIIRSPVNNETERIRNKTSVA